MHTFRARTTLILTLTGAMILSASGCEDAASKERDQVRVQLSEARAALQNTLAKGGETYQQDLNSVVTKLAAISGGEPGQQAAKSLLAANALRELAMTHVNVASDIESRHRAELGATNSRINAALRLQSLASGLEGIDAQRRRTELQSELQKAMEGVTAAQTKMTELESPISERTTQNTQQKSEIERLRLQVGDLMRQAQAAGYSAGLETFKQATQINRQADRIEYEVSNREIDLEHDLTPQHKMAETQKAQLEAMGRSIEAAQVELDTFGKAAQGDAQASRAKAADLSAQVNAKLAEIKTNADGPLKAAYDEALAALERAVTNARSGGAGSDAGAAKTMGVGLQELSARVHLSAANGMADRISTLKRIKAATGAIKVDGVDGRIAELTAARQTHINAAKTALEEASQAASSIGGNSSEVAALQANLAALSAAIDAPPAAPASVDSTEAVDPAPTTPPAADAPAADAPTTPPEADAPAADAPAADSPATDAAPTSPEAPATGGAESTDALLATLKSVKKFQDSAKVFDLTLPPQDQHLASLRLNYRKMVDGAIALDKALMAKFNKGVLDMQGSQLANASMVADAELVTADETNGQVKLTDTNGNANNVAISQVGGRWFIGSPDDDTAALSAIGLGGAASGQMPAAQVTMMLSMFESLGAALTEVAASVDSGELATFEAAQAKADARLAEVQAQAMGMPPPTPAPGTPPGGETPNK